MNILLLTHDFGFPEGYAPTLRARLVARALVQAGASVQVYCLRYSEIPPDILNTRASGVYEGVSFRYTSGITTRASSFVGRRATDVRSVAATMSSILRMRSAGKLDAVYLWSTAMHWNPLSQTFLSFLNAARIPVVLELNERPWNQGPHPTAVEKHLSPLRGIRGAIVISDYLEEWAAGEAKRLRRDIGVIRVPILVDTDEVQRAPALPPRDKPFVMFACPPGRTGLFRFVAQAMQEVWRHGAVCDLVITGPSLHEEQNRWMAQIVGGANAAGSGEGVAASGAGAADSGKGVGAAEAGAAGSGEGGGAGRSAGSIDWLGTVSRDTLLGLYRQASALLLPLADELNSTARFPTKLGEYLASGTPVVASGRGELLSYLKDGDSAYLAGLERGPADPDTFGRRIVEVLSDPAAAAGIGQKGREVAVREFDYRRYGGVLYDWFRAMIDR